MHLLHIHSLEILNSPGSIVKWLRFVSFPLPEIFGEGDESCMPSSIPENIGLRNCFIHICTPGFHINWNRYFLRPLYFASAYIAGGVRQLRIVSGAGSLACERLTPEGHRQRRSSSSPAAPARFSGSALQTASVTVPGGGRPHPLFLSQFQSKRERFVDYLSKMLGEAWFWWLGSVDSLTQSLWLESESSGQAGWYAHFYGKQASKVTDSSSAFKSRLLKKRQRRRRNRLRRTCAWVVTGMTWQWRSHIKGLMSCDPCLQLVPFMSEAEGKDMQLGRKGGR